MEQATKIFVVGPPRSGTTLVYSLIAGESFLPECTFVSTLTKVFDEIYKYGDEERFGYYGHTLANLVEIFKKPIYDFLYTAVLKVGRVSTNRFIYKDPMLTLYLDYFPLFFNDSYKVVFCVRDPRDAVTSMFNVLRKKNNEDDTDAVFEEAMNFLFPFYRTIYQLDEALVNIDRDKLIFIKYEDLVSGDNETVQGLENFLGMTINLQGVDGVMKDRLDETSPFYSENYGKPITTHPVGRYKDSLTSDQIIRIEHVFSYYMDRLKYKRIGEPGFIQLKPQKHLEQILSLQRELRKSQQQISSLQQELHSSRQEISDLEMNLRDHKQEMSNLYSILSRMPLASNDLRIERAEEALWNLYEYYRSPELSETILRFEGITKIHARLIAANLCLRDGRYKRALVHIIRVGMMDPLALFSIQAIRIIGNGLTFRLWSSWRR
jgi:hypothetical protein